MTDAHARPAVDPRPDRRRRRRGLVAGVLALVVAAGSYTSLTLLGPTSPASATASSFETPDQAAPELTFPDYGATAVQALGYDDSLTTSGDERPRPIASISKVVSALVVLDERPLDGGDGPTITFDADDAALYDSYLAQNGKVAPMPAGLRLTERQALEVSLIESANNYADALALWAFGSSEAFVDAADDWLDENGLTSTTIVEPTGMSPANTSTATDLVTLGTLALEDPVVAEIVRTDTTTIPGVGEIENSNELLGLDGVTGIKTGTLDEAGACLLFSADYTIGDETVTVVGVMLGGVDHDALDVDVTALLGSALARFQTIDLTREGDAFARYDLPWGATSEAVTTEDASVLVWGDETIEARVTTDPIGPDAAGTEVGAVRFTVDDETIEVPLVLAGDIPEPGAWWRLTHPGEIVDGLTRAS
jgi:D-alanyl-D-alanine carboxypeptidase (penicillin-binding protein 5/6)